MNSPDQWVKTFRPWDLLETSVQNLLELEVELAVLSAELSTLANGLSRIDESCRGLRLSLQEQELPDIERET